MITEAIDESSCWTNTWSLLDLMQRRAEQTTHGREINDSFFNITLLSAIGWP